MTIEELNGNEGRTIKFKWMDRGRLVKINKDHIIIDLPEQRSFSAIGKLFPMPKKKIYFHTLNPTWNLKNIVGFDDNYKFELKQFEPGNVTTNYKPDINTLEPIKK